MRVGPVLAERVEVWRAVAAERGVTPHHPATAPDVTAMTTPGHLEQILDNVLASALDFAPDGGTVTVESRDARDAVAITVTDTGPGLSPAERERAFDRFWRGPGHRDRPGHRARPGSGLGRAPGSAGLRARAGSGLGLAIVKQLVTDDGGTIRLDDAPGGGLAVRILLRGV